MQQAFEGLLMLLLQADKVLNGGIWVGCRAEECLEPILLLRKEDPGREAPLLREPKRACGAADFLAGWPFS